MILTSFKLWRKHACCFFSAQWWFNVFFCFFLTRLTEWQFLTFQHAIFFSFNSQFSSQFLHENFRRQVCSDICLQFYYSDWRHNRWRHLCVTPSYCVTYLCYRIQLHQRFHHILCCNLHNLHRQRSKQKVRTQVQDKFLCAFLKLSLKNYSLQTTTQY